MSVPEWITDIENIIGKNNKRGDLKVFLFILGEIILIVSLFFGQIILGGVIFICLLMSLLIVPKSIQLSFSEILAYDLYQIYVNIKKYNGKNKHFQEECFGYINAINSDIIDYIKRKRKETVMDFDYERIIYNLNKLKEQNEKIYSFFKNFELNKNKKVSLQTNYKLLYEEFHKKDKFSETHVNLIENLNKIDINISKLRFSLRKFCKTYLYENKLIFAILVYIIYAFFVWNIPNAFLITMSIESRLVIIIPAAIPIVLVILNQKQNKKSNGT